MGVDKDNKFTILLETKYFISFKGDIFIDPDLSKLLPSETEIKNTYEDYKSSSATQQDQYLLKLVLGDKKKVFLDKYNFCEHSAHLSNIF